MFFLKYVVILFALCSSAHLMSKEGVEKYTEPADVVLIGKLPWIVQQHNYYGSWCTGFLITRRHVITAAHCLDSQRETLNLTIVFNNLENQAINKVKRFIIHPRHTSPTNRQIDIAIMELSEDVILDNHPVL